MTFLEVTILETQEGTVRHIVGKQVMKHDDSLADLFASVFSC